MDFSYDCKSLLRDGRRWFPVMGEIHYARLPETEWEDALYKMKAGGVSIASSCVFWIHHEEIEGAYDFTGRRNLRCFVEAVKSAELYLFLRIGPWCHGEVRNGGFPDWLLGKGFPLRCNDERYLAEAEKWYRAIFKQVEGLFFKDGGPILGVQIENEFGQVYERSNMEGEAHMRTLTALAKTVGFDAPYFTATGWGAAATGGLLPVMGGYCEAPWDQGLTALGPSGNFVFTPERNDDNIGSDHAIGYGLSFDQTKFPYLMAELGGGLQATRHRRPIATAVDAAAMSTVKMGSGANLLGYYMYCGGENPDGKRSSLQESRESGYPNDLPEKNYDFRAPIGAFGQITDTWREIRLLSGFIRQFGEVLAGMDTFIPPDNPLDPRDNNHLRYSIRHNGDWGFLFVNNYVKGQARPDFSNVRLNVLGQELPPFDVKCGEYGIYPFNMPVHGGVVHFAQATPLCVTGTTTVFYGESIDATPGADVRLISKAEALRMEELLDELEAGECEIERLSSHRWRLKLPVLDADAYDYGLNIRYRGESARAYVSGKLVADDFYADGYWYVGLKRLGFPAALEIEIEPLEAGALIYLEVWPVMEGGSVCTLDTVHLVKLEKTDRWERR